MMANSKILRIGILVALVAAAGWMTWPQSEPVVARADGGEIHEGMEKMGRSWRQLRRAKNDFPKVLTAATAMQEAVLQCKDETPKTVEVLDESQRPKALLQYRMAMIEMMEELLNVEKAALARDTKKMNSSIAKLGALQKHGHKQFKGDD